jgi:hypothetical protein
MLNTVFLKSVRLLDDVGNNVLKEPDRPQTTIEIRRMRFECWITEATNTLSNCVILIVVPQQQQLRKRVSILHVRTLPHLSIHGVGSVL